MEMIAKSVLQRSKMCGSMKRSGYQWFVGENDQAMENDRQPVCRGQLP
jgi:hypothetical protein